MSRQNYYARRRVRQTQDMETALIVGLVRAERQVQPRLGARKLRVVLAAALVAAGVKVGRDRLFKLLGENGLLLAPLPREYVRTTNSYHCLPVFVNLVKGLAVTGPHQVMVSDLTFIRTLEGFYICR